MHRTGNPPNLSRTFLHACQNNDLSSVKSLASSHNIQDWTRFRHDISGDTPLHVAAREGHLSIVKYLCENWNEPKYKANVANKDMKRPLHEAAQFAHDNVAKYLIGQGVSIDSLKRGDWTPLMLACTKTGIKACETIAALLEAKADPLLRNKDGWTPLFLTCRAGDENAFNLLFKYAPECVDDRSKNGRSAMHIAAFHGRIHIIISLSTLNPNLLNARDLSGSTPLHEAVKGGNFETVKRLVELGADVKAVDDVHNTILHISALTGHDEITEYILQNNLIDLYATTKFGLTPLGVAERSKQKGSIEILKKYNVTNEQN